MKLKDCKRCRNHIYYSQGWVMCDFFKIMHVNVMGVKSGDRDDFNIFCPKEREPGNN